MKSHHLARNAKTFNCYFFLIQSAISLSNRRGHKVGKQDA